MTAEPTEPGTPQTPDIDRLPAEERASGMIAGIGATAMSETPDASGMVAPDAEIAPAGKEADDAAIRPSETREPPKRERSEANSQGYFNAADIAGMYPGKITPKRVKRIIAALVNDPKFPDMIISHTKADAYGTPSAHYRNTKDNSSLDSILQAVAKAIESDSDNSAS